MQYFARSMQTAVYTTPTPRIVFTLLTVVPKSGHTKNGNLVIQWLRKGPAGGGGAPFCMYKMSLACIYTRVRSGDTLFHGNYIWSKTKWR